MFHNSPPRPPRRTRLRDLDDAARARHHCLRRAELALAACFVSTVLCALSLTVFDNHSGITGALSSWLTSAGAVTSACIVHYYLARHAALAGRRYWLIAIVEAVASIVRRGPEVRTEDPRVTMGMRILRLAAFLLPGDSRAETLTTARDVLYAATGAAPTRRAFSAVVLRILGDMLTAAVHARNRRLVGAGGGSGTALTVTSSVLALLGLHPSFADGVALVVSAILLGAIIGGWVTGIGERRVP